MANTLVVELIREAAGDMHDRQFTRWAAQEWLVWFNEARRAVISKRPDAYSENRIFVCSENAKQTLPEGAARLLDVVGNRGGSGITAIDPHILDLRIPDWLSSPPSNRVRHFVYRSQDPKHFYLYPRPRLGLLLEIIVSRYPEDTVIENFDTDDQTILIDDSFSNALKFYMLSRAWSKDANFANNPGLAAVFFNQFRSELGEATSADSATAPTGG